MFIEIISLSELNGFSNVFSCVASGVKITYSWSHNGGSPLPGQVSRDLVISSRDISFAGNYECIVTDYLGVTAVAVGTLIVHCE